MLKDYAMIIRDGDPINICEIVCGPLSAIPCGTPGTPPPRLNPTSKLIILYVEGGIFNF
jgi:hypothetical protein